jgi:hypothetical protein
MEIREQPDAVWVKASRLTALLLSIPMPRRTVKKHEQTLVPPDKEQFLKK